MIAGVWTLRYTAGVLHATGYAALAVAECGKALADGVAQRTEHGTDLTAEQAAVELNDLYLEGLVPVCPTCRARLCVAALTP